MKKFLLVLIIFFLLYRNVHAAENNIFGVHILFPEEIKEAADLVNSSGGDWGYVVIPIQATDRNLVKWQTFMDDCRKFHVIPIIRLATYPVGSNWVKPDEYESVDFANFLSSLNWPTKKKIVAVYNEPNHSNEWGGEVNPVEYSDVLSDTIDQFKKRDTNFVVLNAALDASAPNSDSTMDEYDYMRQMILENPDIFQKTDAFNAHAYPNPGFSAGPFSETRFGISSYNHEISFLQDYFGIYGLKVYITETGWKKSTFLTDELIAANFKNAFNEVWKEDYIMAVAPFLLKADAGDFKDFALISNGAKNESYKAIAALPKKKGKPELEKEKAVIKEQTPLLTGVKPAIYVKKEKEEPIKFKTVWKRIINWVLR